MDFSTKIHDWASATLPSIPKIQPDCIVVGVFEEHPLSGIAHQIDLITGGLIQRLIQANPIQKCGTTQMLFEVKGLSACRLLLVGLGARQTFSEKAFIKAVRSTAKTLSTSTCHHILWTLAQTSNETLFLGLTRLYMDSTNSKIPQADVICFNTGAWQSKKIKECTSALSLSHSWASFSTASLHEGNSLSSGFGHKIPMVTNSAKS